MIYFPRFIEMKRNILVSVCMITYKHEQFIAQAIEGVLMQEADFEIELIIADDASPDNTESIVNHYVNNHPKGPLIRYTKHEKNLGIMRNFIWALKQCKGEYIAICEGDDYWTDPGKSQKQVDFLEQNKDYVICFGNCEVLDQLGNKVKTSKLHKEQMIDYNEIELVKAPLIPTLTVLFRNFGDYNINYKITNGDALLFAYLSKFGRAKFLNFNFGSYRIHSTGVWSQKSKINRKREACKTKWAIFQVVEKNLKSHALYSYYLNLNSLKKISENHFEIFIINLRLIYVAFLFKFFITSE